MIFAELRGKLGTDFSRAHERAEDVLTSSVFGLLRYLPVQEGIAAILRRVRPVRTADTAPAIQTDPEWLELSSATDCEIEFWPRWGDFGEPDLLLTFRDLAKKAIATVLIEAKLYSGKSGAAEDDEETDAEAPDPDQLVKYWRRLQRVPAVTDGVQCGLIYLTTHGSPPLDELCESIRRAPAMRLAWLSWRDVWTVADRLASQNRIAADLEQLLTHKGLNWFRGFRATAPAIPTGGGFWRGGWFSQPAKRWPIAGFWKPTGAMK